MGRGIENQNPVLDVIMDDLPNHPQCPHGPMLLFAQKNRKFYACSACRDRKLCPYFIQYGTEVSAAHLLSCAAEREKLEPASNIDILRQKVVKLLKKKKKVDYCHSCECFVLGSEEQGHSQHEVTANITFHHFTHPSELLKPSERDKKEAQYLFSSSAVSVILNLAQKNNLRKLLCIGSPRVHEYVNSSDYRNMHSLLLDIDTRYHSFHSRDKFCWYNSFNNYFFDSSCLEEVLKPFLLTDANDGILLVLDPPFGGRMEPLAYSINEMRKLHQEVNEHLQNPTFKVVWVCPYFMEPYILDACPKLRMLDYKVYYENHPLFSQGSKIMKKGSPVRIFTDIPLEKCELPAEEGYRFCPVCRQWSSQENKHCTYCNKCTSKNGTTYEHCFKCDRCVKPSWKHCNTCGRCCLTNHKCGTFVPSGVCYHCGGEGHRKGNCPQNEKLATKRKKRKVKYHPKETPEVIVNTNEKKTKVQNKRKRL
ncbi:rRNA N6-adenosine-methyltransferase ZCCHC4 [Schistocerca cancellata]|uniref:rRNA N6-adenosine-methyltransferase ZCCHC4 n=1 Tax=Schistocerca cancellata TaxID=274614 RepID=UPI0021194294|nr:rRNA N6-adenosine-methyltransferase ZCCHC4 [Schistocerca cancellata]